MVNELEVINEVAKATGKVADLSRSAGIFLDDVFGKSLRQVGGAAEDRVKAWRLENFYKCVDKAHRITERRKVEGRPVPLPPAELLPLIEGASLESADSIQNLWAALLANAVDPGKRVRPRKVFIEIIRGLEPIDAVILQYLAQPDIEKRFTLISEETLSAAYLADAMKSSFDDVLLSLQSLHRYGCIIDSWEQTIEQLDRGYQGFRVNNPKSNFRLSHLGRSLIAATSQPDDQE